MTKNCWRSVDAHFHDGAGRVLQSVLPIKAANNSFMTDYNLSEAWFPRTHDKKIVDAPLTLIFMMEQGGYCNLFCLWRQPLITLWLTTTYRRREFPGYMTKNRWHSIHAHCHDGAGRVLQSVLPIKAAKNSCMTDYNLSEVWSPRTHDQKLLMLHWRSFCHGCIRNMQSFNFAQSIIHIVLADFLEFLFTFFLITTLFFNNT